MKMEFVKPKMGDEVGPDIVISASEFLKAKTSALECAMLKMVLNGVCNEIGKCETPFDKDIMLDICSEIKNSGNVLIAIMCNNRGMNFKRVYMEYYYIQNNIPKKLDV